MKYVAAALLLLSGCAASGGRFTFYHSGDLNECPATLLNRVENTLEELCPKPLPTPLPVPAPQPR